MPRAAVLGQPIEHSLSPVLHNAGYAALGLDDWSYERIECDAQALPGLVSGAAEDFRGFSVTMPGKFAAFHHATELSERAQLMGSVNTLVRTPTGWRGDNTDTEGVAGALAELFSPGLNPRGPAGPHGPDGSDGPVSSGIKRALVIGAGGTARPALWALAQLGVRHVDMLNRRDRREEFTRLTAALGIHLEPCTYSDNLAALARQADVVVSTVPSAAIAGKEDQLAHAPVLDVIYDPLPTPLTVHAAADGYPTVAGHRLLAHQAFSQFEQFTGQPAPREAMFAALDRALSNRTLSNRTLSAPTRGEAR